MSRSFTSCLSMFAIVVALAGVRPCDAQAPSPVSNQQVQDQIDKLDADEIGDRDAAEKQLTDWATANQLTPQQIGMIKAARSDPSLERSFRAKRVIEAYLSKNTAVQAVLRPLKTKSIGPVGPNGAVTIYVCGFPGECQPDNKRFVEISRRYGAVRDAILAGDTTIGADGLDPITRALNRLRDYIDSLSDQEFQELKLWDPTTGDPATRQQVLDEIQKAKNAVPEAKNAIGSLSGGNLPPSATLAHVLAGTPSHPDLGRSFALAFDRVDAGTNLDVCWFVDSETLSNPPPGYQPVGHVIDVLPIDNSLVAYGSVTVSIAIGSSTIGNPVADPALLRIAHLANGRFDLLPSVVDVPGGWVTATYPLPPVGSGLEPLGEFAIVQPVGTTAAPGPVGHGLSLAAPRPNPCAGSVHIAYTLPVPGLVELEIYDVRGARVKALVRAFVPAGVHESVWDGRSDSGVKLDSGCYFLRLRTGGEHVVKTMLRIR
jgi:hypothetical protein